MGSGSGWCDRGRAVQQPVQLALLSFVLAENAAALVRRRLAIVS